MSLLVHTIAHGVNTYTTSPGINTAGAKVIVAAVTTLTTKLTSFTDSLSNTWAPQGAVTGSGIDLIFLTCNNPTTGALQTFTCTGTGMSGSCAVAAFSDPWLGQIPSLNGTTSTSGTTLQPGATVHNTGDLIVSASATGNANTTFSIDNSFAITDQVATSTFVGIALAYLFATSGGSINPTWTIGATADLATAFALAMIYPGPRPAEHYSPFLVQ